MQVDISHISKAESGPEALYAITFTLLSGRIYIYAEKYIQYSKVEQL